MKFLFGVLILPAILLINSCSSHREYIGMPIEEAQALARKRNVPNRVSGGMMTLDFIYNRLNFVVKNGKVVRVRRDDGGR